MAYFPDIVPYSLDPDLTAFLEKELQKIAEALEEPRESVTLFPTVAVPAKYMEGTLANFVAGMYLPDGTEVLEGGYHVFRDGVWRRLVEV